RRIRNTLVPILLFALSWGRVAAGETPVPSEGGTEESTDSAGEPTLPAGLDREEEEPTLPAGFSPPDEAPSLPPGLGEEAPTLPGGLDAGANEASLPFEAPSLRERLPFVLSGFLDLRGGARIPDDPYEDRLSLGEARLQIALSRSAGFAALQVTGDLLYDAVAEDHDVDLERGRGFFDLREASLSFTPVDFLDLKIGRQILTWGTGDLLFINDLFPKDWQAFFLGREQSYLKAPSDALKASLFAGIVNLDFVYTPRFDADRYITGERLSYWNPLLARRAGQDAIVTAQRPDRWFEDDEFAGRLYRNFSGVEAAIYGYHGFWKSPMGFDPATMQATFPSLSVVGASLRRPFLGGIGNVEGGYYRSEDHEGTDPFTPNDEFRFLAGFEKEVLPELTLSLQYDLTHTAGDDATLCAANPDACTGAQNDHLLTLRLTRLLLQQTLTLSLFTFYAPADEDLYLRPLVAYQLNDHWSLSAGANIFWGKEDDTFFGQFEKNTNLYAALRFAF
ncbi:MAG: hypothetical protein D6812_10275, partial [Deltaproteobacteria bacterium]